MHLSVSPYPRNRPLSLFPAEPLVLVRLGRHPLATGCACEIFETFCLPLLSVSQVALLVAAAAEPLSMTTTAPTHVAAQGLKSLRDPLDDQENRGFW